MATSAPLRTPGPSAARGWRWALLGAALGTLLTLSLFAPARWLASAMVQWTDGHLRLVNARGTVWNGTAGLVFASGVGGAEAISLPGQFHWRLRPRWNGVSAELDLPCCAAAPLQLRVHPRSNGVQLVLADSKSRWPAAMLVGFGAPFNTLKTEGVIDLTTQAFALEVQGRQLALQGRATLDASDISSSLSTLRPMGSYRLALEGGSAPSLLLTTREGSLQLNGSGYWTGTAMRFSGEASAAPGSEDALSNLLNIIGRRNGARSLITLG
jgi:general secretion pathway protein N